MNTQSQVINFRKCIEDMQEETRSHLFYGQNKNKNLKDPSHDSFSSWSLKLSDFECTLSLVWLARFPSWRPVITVPQCVGDVSRTRPRRGIHRFCSDEPPHPSAAAKRPSPATLSVATRQSSSRQRRPPLDNDRVVSLAPASLAPASLTPAS